MSWMCVCRVAVFFGLLWRLWMSWCAFDSELLKGGISCHGMQQQAVFLHVPLPEMTQDCCCLNTVKTWIFWTTIRHHFFRFQCSKVVAQHLMVRLTVQMGTMVLMVLVTSLICTQLTQLRCKQNTLPSCCNNLHTNTKVWVFLPFRFSANIYSFFLNHVKK